jgi:hypothetical protein
MYMEDRVPAVLRPAVNEWQFRATQIFSENGTSHAEADSQFLITCCTRRFVPCEEALVCSQLKHCRQGNPRITIKNSRGHSTVARQYMPKITTRGDTCEDGNMANLPQIDRRGRDSRGGYHVLAKGLPSHDVIWESGSTGRIASGLKRKGP